MSRSVPAKCQPERKGGPDSRTYTSGNINILIFFLTRGEASVVEGDGGSVSLEFTGSKRLRLSLKIATGKALLKALEAGEDAGPYSVLNWSTSGWTFSAKRFNAGLVLTIVGPHASQSHIITVEPAHIAMFLACLRVELGKVGALAFRESIEEL